MELWYMWHISWKDLKHKTKTVFVGVRGGSVCVTYSRKQEGAYVQCVCVCVCVCVWEVKDVCVCALACVCAVDLASCCVPVCRAMQASSKQSLSIWCCVLWVGQLAARLWRGGFSPCPLSVHRACGESLPLSGQQRQPLIWQMNAWANTRVNNWMNNQRQFT